MRTRLSSLGWLLIAAGFVAIGAGWDGVQSTPVVAVQVSYLVSGGLVGIALVMLGLGLVRHDDVGTIRALAEELLDRVDDVAEDLASVRQAAEGRRPQDQRPPRAVRKAS
jgi:hypothetical protein